MRITHWWLWW